MGNIHWNTPAEILNPIRDMCGQIDLDPCSNETSIVNARKAVCRPSDGLSVVWPAHVSVGGACFVNPPYSREDNAIWAKAFFEESFAFRRFGKHLFALVQAAPGTDWFKYYLGGCDAVCFPEKRIAFLRDGEPVRGANFGNALFYAGSHPDQFRLHFESLGSILFT